MQDGVVLKCKMDQNFKSCFRMQDGSRLLGFFGNARWI